MFNFFKRLIADEQGFIGTAAAIGAGISALAPMVGGAIGNIASAGDRDRANAAAKAAFDEINSVNAPPDVAQKILLKHFQSAGVLTPELEKNINLGVSQVSQIKDNANTTDAQKSALELIKQRAQGGLSPADRAAFNKLQAKAQQDAEAKRQQVIQSFQQRGMGGSGAELAAQLAGSQAGIQQEASNADNVSAAASQNALQALGQQSNMASQMRGQDFSENATKAQAADEFNRFNVSNQIAQQARNVGAQNQAQQQNLANSQNISNANTSADNAELQRENDARMQVWNAQMAQAKAKADANTNVANIANKQAANTAQGWTNIGQGVGAAAGNIASLAARYPSTPKTSSVPTAGFGSDDEAWKKYANPNT